MESAAVMCLAGLEAPEFACPLGESARIGRQIVIDCLELMIGHVLCAHSRISRDGQTVVNVRHPVMVRLPGLDSLGIRLTGEDAVVNDAPVAQYMYRNTGDSDVSPHGTSSQFLLFRGLEPSVNEELLSKGALKLNQVPPSSSQPATSQTKGVLKITSSARETNPGAKEGTLKRVLLVKDRQSNESWRYGFAEYASIDDATAALAKYNSLPKFTISSKQVMVSFVHAGVFIPAQNYAPQYEHLLFNPLGNSSMKLMYWDEGAYVSELMLVPVEESSRSTERLKTSKTAAADNATTQEGLVPPTEVAKTKKRKTEASDAPSRKKIIAPHLDFWRNRHAELHGITSSSKQSLAGEASSKPTSTSKSSTPPQPTSSTKPPLPAKKTETFADLRRNCCLLCSRQFQTSTEVHKHESQSKLHATNLLNNDLVAIARGKLAKIPAAHLPTTNSPEDDKTYRDRASERRKAFNQPKNPASSSSAKTTTTIATEQPSSKASAQINPPIPSSKGAALLQKIGFSGDNAISVSERSKGLIQTDMYVAGVGLGAQGGKRGDAAEEAERMTKAGAGGWGDGGFAERTREGARGRFKEL